MLSVTPLAVPLLVVVVRVLVSPGPVSLSGDLSLIDLHVRDAMRLRQELGPYDRFGWSHPGPAYFYLLALPALLVGSGARTEVAGAAVLGTAAALAAVWVVRRRAGSWAGAACAVALGFLAFVLSVPHVEAPLGMGASPWNPYVVVFPVVLFVVLCAAALAGSALSLLGAALAGSFAVQTDFSTFPVVAVLFAGTAIGVGARAARGRRGAASPAAAGGRRFPRSLVPGVVVLVVLWVPPLVQECTGHPGNLTALWNFFTGHLPARPVASGLWAVLAVDAFLDPWVRPGPRFEVLGSPHGGALLVLAAAVGLGAVVTVLGVARARPFAAALGGMSLVGAAVLVLTSGHLVGPLFDYLVLYEVSLPLAAVIGLGVVVVGEAEAPGGGRRRRASGLPVPAVAGLACVAAAVTSLGTLRAVDAPTVRAFSSASVAGAYRDVAAHLRPGAGGVVLAEGAPSDQAELGTLFGLFDQLQAHGYRPRLGPFWTWLVAPGEIADGREPVRIGLFLPSGAVTRMPGYVGDVGSADLVVTRQAPG